MDTRDKHTPVNSSTATHAEMDELLRQIEALEARLAVKDAASREPAAESEIASLGSLAAYSSTMVSQSFTSLTEAAARYCRAARASIWLFDADRSAVHCEDLFESGPARHSGGSVIRAGALPTYFTTLETGEIIDAGNVNTDPRTAEFAGAFLAQLEIGAILDVPVVDGDRLAGVLHIEHIGAPRTWSAQERLCAITIATRVSLSLQNKERAKTLEADLHNAELLRIAAETAHVIAWEWDPDTDLIRWGSNPEWLLGPLAASEENATGPAHPGFGDLMVAEDYENLLANARSCLMSGDGFADSFRLRRTDNETRWILVRGEIAKQGGGKRLIGVAVDNHNQHQAEIQAEQLSRQHRALLDNLPDFAWTKDLEGRYTAVNRAFANSVGREPGDIIGSSQLDFMPAHVHASVREQDRKVIESRQTVRDEGRYLVGGKQGWTEIFKAPIFDRTGSVLGVVGVSHDITERKAAENLLAESEKRFRDFAGLGADWYWKQDAELRLVELTSSGNDAPVPTSIPLGMLRWEIPGVDPLASDWESHKATLAARQPFRDFVFAIVNADRRRTWARVSGMPLYDALGNFIGYHGVGRDITAQMRVTDQLRVTQERLEMALSGSQLCIWDLDLRTGDIFLSEGWSRFYGDGEGPTHTTIEALNSTLHPDDVDQVKAAFVAAIRGDSEKYEVEHRSRTKDGTYRWLYSRGKVTARDNNGRAIRISGTNLDIEDRRAMQDAIRTALQEQQSLMDTCPTGLAIARNRAFLRLNAAYGRLLGYGPDELIGKSTRILFSDDASWVAAGNLIYETGRTDNFFSSELELIRKDGSPVWVLLSGNIIDLQNNYGIYSMIDITSQRNLADALARAKDAADSANRAKSGFLATMSHEIRTPMNGVLGMLELLELGGLESNQRDTVHTIRSQAHALLGIIDEILDFSKIEAGQLSIRPEPMSMAHLYGQLCAVYREMATGKGLKFVQQIDPTMAPAHIGDGVRIRQIINNLLSNAIKFTDSGEIRISVLVERRFEHGNDILEDLRICIEDTGIGVSSEDHEKLFQPFVQADSRSSRRFGGTGLGLSICKRLAEAMGGGVRMHSNPGRGTVMTLSLSLPVTAADRIAVEEAPPKLSRWQPLDPGPGTSAHARPESILIAEDHVVNLRLIQRQLELLGFKTDTASNGQEALEKWRGNSYALLITDCQMPVMDGYELTMAIRAEENARGAGVPMPIIACTANALAGDAELCLSAGMSDYVAKPVSMAALQEKLSRWLPEMTARRQTRPPSAKSADPGTAPAPSLPPPLMPRALQEFSGGDAEAEREILEQYRMCNEKDSSALLHGIEVRDISSVLHTSHRIKGASRAIGAVALADVCEQIEKGAKADDWMQINGARAALIAERDRLIDYLDARAEAACDPNPQKELPL